ncbi:heterotetrameric sarcosine oxidase gamma subunit [Hoeflea marina]|uniref:Heterotetrameric sarcosine oxidase gamma subunit n=1 Tax=Hoeflea marina TaxID=274592 RepID=A0A317PF37_9HYPH|nr:sarcosine oxidase subunit gamma family protein [Hoeflea marina]PWV97196.1 heterotetrameric sarcosine oxidase gamma subunit [Hoeflea marina]
MADIAHAHRSEPLSGRVAGAAGVTVTPAPAAGRVALRVNPSEAGQLSSILGLALPLSPKTSVTTETGRMALWLGPDEWLLIDASVDAGPHLTSALCEAGVLVSAVDVSHRNTAILVEGAGAQATLESGCPQNLSLTAFPVGACSRTVLGKIEVVILRTGAEAFRVECWRSFSDYAFTFLADAAGDALA